MSKLIFSSSTSTTAPLSAVLVTSSQSTQLLQNEEKANLSFSTSANGLISKITSSHKSLIRIYSSSTGRNNDNRNIGEAVPSAGIDDLLAEIEIIPDISTSLTTTIFYGNKDIPQEEKIYLSVFNLESESVAIEIILDIVNFKLGADGKSPFELAVENGFTGSLQDWLESLKGKDGATGSVSAASGLILDHISTPAAPGAGETIVYAKSDGNAYFRPHDGDEMRMGNIFSAIVDTIEVISQGDYDALDPPLSNVLYLIEED